MKSLIIAFIFMLFCVLMCSPGKKTEMPKIFWEIQNSGTNASFRGLSVVSETIAWASGSNGTFARTIDGGKTWQTDSIPGSSYLDFRDIQAFDEHTAIVLSAGRPAKIFKTIDMVCNWRICRPGFLFIRSGTQLECLRYTCYQRQCFDGYFFTGIL